jgi:hypothetical protein
MGAIECEVNGMCGRNSVSMLMLTEIIGIANVDSAPGACQRARIRTYYCEWFRMRRS